MTSSTRRLAAAATSTLALAATVVAPTSAQAPEPVPSLTITLVGGGKAPVVDTTGLRPGTTEIVARTEQRRGEPGFVLARLNAGTTAEEIREMTEKRRLTERQIDRLGKVLTTFVAQGSAMRGRDYRTTIDLVPGTYVALDISSERRQPQTSFDVAGDRTLAPLPDVDATVDMRDFRFTKTQRTLPADGTLRVRNRGKQLHFMLAFPTSSSRNASRLQTLLRRRDRASERRAERLVAGAPSEPVGLISPGVENRVKVNLRKGHYVLVCFYGSPASRNRGHNTLGMARKVQFR